MIRFDQVGMRAIVDGVACDHEADRGHVQAGGLIGIGVADINRDDFVAFKGECSAFQPLGGDEFRGDQSRKSTTPSFDGSRREGGPHGVHYLRGRDRAGLGKAIAQKLEAEEMIGMGMGDVDRGQTLP